MTISQNMTTFAHFVAFHVWSPSLCFPRGEMLDQPYKENPCCPFDLVNGSGSVQRQAQNQLGPLWVSLHKPDFLACSVILCPATAGVRDTGKCLVRGEAAECVIKKEFQRVWVN